MRGYFSTFKYTQSGLLLNLNTATSAFFRPLIVSDGLNSRGDFPGRSMTNLLKGLRVYITYISASSTRSSQSNSCSRLTQFTSHQPGSTPHQDHMGSWTIICRKSKIRQERRSDRSARSSAARMPVASESISLIWNASISGMISTKSGSLQSIYEFLLSSASVMSCLPP